MFPFQMSPDVLSAFCQEICKEAGSLPAAAVETAAKAAPLLTPGKLLAGAALVGTGAVAHQGVQDWQNGRAMRGARVF